MTNRNDLPTELLAMRARRMERHKAGVRYVQQNHAEFAEWLAGMVQAFGKGEVIYRAVLRK